MIEQAPCVHAETEEWVFLYEAVRDSANEGSMERPAALACLNDL